MTALSWATVLPTMALPARTDPIYPPERAPSKSDLIPLYGDDIWPVRFFSNNPSMEDARILWTTFPPQYVDHFRLAIWSLFNIAVPDEFLAESAAPMVSTLSALRIYHNAIDYRMLGRWLNDRGVPSISQFTATLMADYAEYLRTERRVARGTAVNHLTAITRLWVIGLQLPTLSLPDVPPWVGGRLSDYLPPRVGNSGENDTEPIATSTMSPLLTAALRFIDVGTEPILAAATLNQDIYNHSRAKSLSRNREGAGKLRDYLNDLSNASARFPTKLHNGKVALDCAYIAHTVGVSVSVVYNWSKGTAVRAYAAAHGAPITVPLASSELMPERIARTEIDTYVNYLRAACFIIIAYLTGMRPGEALALEAGSLSAASASGGWMLISSRTFKTVRDADGNHDSNGRIRDAPWVAVTPVVKAIRALERLQPRGLLFPSVQHVKSSGRSVGITTIADVVNRFIDHINRFAPGTIPPDPRGRVTPIRFRRTLAWHIANQPGGLVALAVQYGHLRTAISEGYASRVRDGIQDLVDFETARSIAYRLSDAAESFDNGVGVSGPSALRFVEALREQTAQFGGIVASQRQARSLLNNTKLTVFQNADAFLWCNFKNDTALCLIDRDDADRATTPRLDRCKANCSNVARTDSDASALRLTAASFRQQATHMPRPAADRLNARADDLVDQADMHDRDRFTIEQIDANF